MAADEAHGLFVCRQSALELFILDSRQNLLEARAWLQSHCNKVVACHQRLRPDRFVRPPLPLLQRVSIGFRLFVSGERVNAREIEMIFEAIYTEKAFKTADGHLTHLGESG